MCENSKPAILASSHRCGLPRPFSSGPVKARIAAFLDGESDGSELLHALYDHVLDEPIPPAMRELLNE